MPEAPQAITDPPLLIDKAEVLRLLSIGETTLKGLIRTGRFPLRRHRLCRKSLYSREELIAWQRAGMPPASRWSGLREISSVTVAGRRAG